MAHDQRTGDERWAWLASIPEDELARGLVSVAESMVITLHANDLPASLRPGDLGVYCGAETGALVGAGEIVASPDPGDGSPGQSRVKVLPQVLLHRASAPSISRLGMRPRSLGMPLGSDSYLRLRDLVLSAAVPLIGESFTARAPSPSDGEEQESGARIGDLDRSGDEPWAWLIPVPEEDLDRDFQRALEKIAITFDAASLPAMQRVGDLVVFCGAEKGDLTGVGEVVGEPRVASADTTRRRLRVLPLLLLDRTRAQSIGDVGLTPRRLQTRLYPESYERIRALLISAALRPPTAAEHSARSSRPAEEKSENAGREH